FFSLMSHVRLYFLFYSCPCDHLDFHSFPTRRSSDLIVATAAELDGPLVIDGHGVFGEAADGQFMRARYGEVDLVATGNGQSEERDRKSTRLNSSHGSISYAVFCLKKKTIN